jgi:endogenous inhibitor of DNA gyrase (YacG/DUF329 family)
MELNRKMSHFKVPPTPKEPEVTCYECGNTGKPGPKVDGKVFCSQKCLDKQ